ncbi:rab proteins geranylgeranyltransferase component A [Armigeres subalbatus]|uniref:rab proteins geranylgeranyltransferase component A n=1 Tax=Armigeres subalbatus TaxID=124917 RepID=UPI002ED0C55A
MDEDLPTEFDLIVVGTGLTESIVAAAASRIGKTVLHLDINEFYGGCWSSFNLESLRNYAEECRKEEGTDGTVNEGAVHDSLALKKEGMIHRVSEEWYNFEELGDVDDWNKEKIMQQFRRFNVDLTPKLLYSRGAMVELLISSNICRYAEFRAVDRVATIWNGRIMTVPCSRSDVFTSRDVNVVEKRLLMKFLQSCASWETAGGEHEGEEVEGKTFLEYLKNQKLTPNLIHYLLYTIAMGNDQTSCRAGLEGVKKFLLSLGRYGNSPFLFPMYGCGEIPQCFCRLCAVFGGVYCLSRPIGGINFAKNVDGRCFQSLKCGSQTIEAKSLVIGQGYVTKEIFQDGEQIEQRQKRCGHMARAVFLINVPLGGASQNTGGGGVALMKLPPVQGHEDGATIIQLAHFSGTCPKEIYLIHVTAKSVSGDPKVDLEPYVSQILSKNYTKPESPEGEEFPENTVSTILYELYFNIPSCTACQQSLGSLPKGVHLACGPLYELDYDESISRARTIFKDIYPEEEFLPRAPDPEEIIIGDEEQTDQAQEVVASAEESDQLDSARECQENDCSPETSPVSVSTGQEAKEEAIDNAEECLEQK